MKRAVAFILVLVACFAVTNSVIADDVEDIKKATMKHFATFNAAMINDHVDHHMAWHSTFGGGGGLLQISDSPEEEKKGWQEAFDAGLKLDLELRHMKVKVYGNMAVVTCYVVGTTTAPDGTRDGVMNRRTAVLVKEAGKWKEVHVHSSPISTPDSQ